MSDKPKSRKLVPHFKQDPGWRHKQHTNPANKKYTRDEILEKYVDRGPPGMVNPELAEVLVSEKSLPPIQRPHTAFTHSLGDDVNSRKAPAREKRHEKTPEWFLEDASATLGKKRKGSDKGKARKDSADISEENKPATDTAAGLKYEQMKDAKNVPHSILEEPEIKAALIEEEFSNVDKLYEEKVKKEVEEDESVPEWDEPNPAETLPPVPSKESLKAQPVSYIHKYQTEYLKAEHSKGNPFASVILESGMIDNQGFVVPLPMTKPYDRIWYYKDPQNLVQGPFSTIEMFNWCTQGYFSSDLPVSHGTREHFIPLRMFNMTRQEAPGVASLFKHYQGPTQSLPTPSTAKTLKEIEETQPGVWGKKYKDMFPELGTEDKQLEKATDQLKNMLGIKTSQPKSGWGNKQAGPVKSLSEIQREQALSKFP